MVVLVLLNVTNISGTVDENTEITEVELVEESSFEGEESVEEETNEELNFHRVFVHKDYVLKSCSVSSRKKSFVPLYKLYCTRKLHCKVRTA